MAELPRDPTIYRDSLQFPTGNTGIGTTAPQGWLDVAGIGRIQKPPNAWRRFWAWALLGWRWEEKNNG